jgi:hypothetical protein
VKSLRLLAASVAAVAFTVGAPAPAAAHLRMIFLPESERQHVEAALQRGNELSKQGKLAEAVDAYRGAWDLERTHRLAANLGNLEFSLGRWADAAEHLSYAVASFPEGSDSKLRDTLAVMLGEAKKQVGTIHLRKPDAGTVYVDGRDADVDLEEEGWLFVPPGVHTIRLESAGNAPESRSIETAVGQDYDLTFVAQPATAMAPPAAAPDAPRKRSRVPVLVGAAVAGAGVAVGSALAIAASSRGGGAASTRISIEARSGGNPAACSNPLPSLAADCASLQGALSSQDALANAALGTFLGAGAVAAVTGVYLLWPASKRAAAALPVSVEPVASGRGGGFAVSGRW